MAILLPFSAIQAEHSDTGRELKFERPALFECLLDLLRNFESQGAIVPPKGCERNIACSDMARFIGDRRKACAVSLGKPPSRSSLVDIFMHASEGFAAGDEHWTFIHKSFASREN
jgi:hypothetical protein